MAITLSVTVRDESTTLDALRANGDVPAVVYGPKQEPISITLSGKEFDKVRKESGESTIVELGGLTESIEVLIKDIEFNPVKQQVIHVDFYAIERGKDMTVNVPLNFIGEAPVEGSNEGSVTKVLQDISVTCRPSNLPSHIDVDLSGLDAVDSKIFVKDLVVEEGVTIDADMEDPVVVVSAARQITEEEEAAEAEEVDMDSIEVEQKGKDESGDSEAAGEEKSE